MDIALNVSLRLFRWVQRHRRNLGRECIHIEISYFHVFRPHDVMIHHNCVRVYIYHELWYKCGCETAVRPQLCRCHIFLNSLETCVISTGPQSRACRPFFGGTFGELSGSVSCVSQKPGPRPLPKTRAAATTHPSSG